MKTIRVLLVDDDAEFGTMMKFRLSREAPHISFHFVESGDECLEYLGSNKVDCILSDFQMSGMGGMEILLALRKQGNEVPFIFLTSQGNEEVARDAFKNGADDYFTKNFGFAHFARITNSIEQAVKKRRAEQSRHKAEAALLLEKKKLEAILANIGDGISIMDREFRIVYQNPAHVEIVGPHIGEYCYRAYQHRDAVCESCPVARSFQDGSIHHFQSPLLTDKGLKYVDITSSPLRDDGNIVASIEVVKDITARWHAEKAIARSREVLNTILDSVHFGMMVVGRDRVIKMANRPALNLMGYKAQSEIVGKTCHNFICPAEAGKCPVLDLGMNIDLSERALLNRDGEKIRILKSVSPVTLGEEEVLLETFIDIRTPSNLLTSPSN